MKQQNYLSLGDAIQAFLEKNGIKDDTEIQQVINSWEQLMGKPISQNTEKIWFSRDTLFIQMKSPVWKNELQLARKKIVEMINKRVGRELVKEVRIK